MKGWAVIVGILIFGMIFSSGCTQPASSPSTLTTTSIQPTPLVTEQTSRPTPQPTVEVTRTIETPLPLTETYTNDETQFSLKLPDGWTVAGGRTSNSYGIEGIYHTYYIVKKPFAENNPQQWGIRITSWENLTSYRKNSAIILRVWLADDYKWRWIVNGLRDDKSGNTYWTTYQDAVVDDVVIGNLIKAKKITNTQTADYAISHEMWEKNKKQIILIPSDSPLSTFMPYCDVITTADTKISYVTVDRSPAGYMYWFEYDDHKKVSGETIDIFNLQTYEEIIKSLKIVKVKP